MITLSWQYKGRDVRGFVCEGHAGYAENDADDIICAAVTALAATTVSALTDILKLETDYDFQSGRLSCLLKEDPEGETAEKAGFLFQTFELGVKQIQMSYGSEYVRVEDIITAS